MTEPSPADSSSMALIIALNYYSVIFLVSGISGSYFLSDSLISALVYFLLWFYFVPPVLCRISIFIWGRPAGIVTIQSKTHTLWWWLFQLQLPFNRFPISEELLRSVPGLYALWLNLWGARVSSFAFWGPGVVVMDRYHLHIAKGVILGTQSLLSAHVIKKQDDGSSLLFVDKIRLDEGVLVGAKANLSPGCHIHAHQTVPFNQLFRPYTELKNGKKTVMRHKQEEDKNKSA